MMRLIVVAALTAAVLVVALGYKRRNQADAALGTRRSASADAVAAQSAPDWPAVDPTVIDATAACTWVVFTTPYCASCSLVESDVRRAFPHHAVRLVDATEQPDLAARYQVRRAPTTLLADHEGNVLERLVGPEAVRTFIGATEDAVLD